MPGSLRQYAGEHFNENCETLNGEFRNHLFVRCVFRDLHGLTFKDCVLIDCKFLTTTPQEALGFTFTVGDCHFWEGNEFSPEFMQLLAAMLIKSKGNDDFRKMLIGWIGERKLRRMLASFARLEQQR